MSRRPRSGPVVAILAAGKGKRMRSETPKVLFDLAGWPLVRHVVAAAEGLKPAKTVVVVGHGENEVRDALGDADVEFARQRDQKGTGHAVRCAQKALGGDPGEVLVLMGDVPLVTTATLRGLLASHRRRRAAATVLTMEVADPTGYGRILRDPRGRFCGIREHRDASRAERSIREVASGILVARAEHLWPALRRLKADNAQGEYYLTDLPEMLLARGEKVAAHLAEDPSEVAGINSLADLAAAARVARARILAEHLARGVRIVDPDSTFIDRGAVIGAGTTIFPFTVITGEVRIGKGCEVGPFSHLRAGAALEEGAQVGNFVEVKKSRVGKGTKAKHLSYIGDAVIGAKTNIGCGTITANYDGKQKHVTTIGDRVHVGSGTVLVAPVTVGDDAVTGAGAIVLSGRDVAAGSTVVGVPARALRAGKGEE